MRLIQIPFSHNCIKVRRALELKGLDYETHDISPLDRGPVLRSTGQRLVPALEDGAKRVFESTAILRHLEEAYNERPLLPDGPDRRAECWILEDWADALFMKLSRRLAYWHVVRTPDALGALFFPGARGLKRRLMAWQARRILTRRFGLSEPQSARDRAEAPRVARLALDRLGGRERLFDERITVADVTLAAMSSPLRAAGPHVRDDPPVRDLLAWGETVLGREITALYDGGP